jgi:hypothetical protein
LAEKMQLKKKGQKRTEHQARIEISNLKRIGPLQHPKQQSHGKGDTFARGG